MLASAALGACLVAMPAYALSEIKPNEAPAPKADEEIEKQPLPPINAVPLPDPIQSAPPADQAEPDDEAEPQKGHSARPAVDPDSPLPEIIYDIEKLPEPVRRMRQLMVDAAQAGNIEKIRPLISLGDDATQLSLGEIEGDPIDFLRELSGDKEGQEILAILEEVLSAGYVHLDEGKPTELYVWPYFFAIPLEKLDARQKVELFKIVTAGDYEDMKTYGAYIFYRVGINVEGKWSFFVAGD
ncbi:alanine and proline-rich secreted protein Apa [Mesorhizobium sp. NBSH29]|uniref:alanine and proline-rich secreted protein Apa n=1 Tax=Mesorhizobium sp. NBSH29 TaxID=2654249 RepID=UPI0021561B9C|nr:alanine and proline-rich secreted protein Apa [Mesorhizobium sp. NBSH29]